MGYIMRFTLGAICFSLLVIHYFDHDGHGVSAFKFFGSPQTTCDAKDGTCPATPTGPSPKTNHDYFTSASFLTGTAVAVVGVALYLVSRSQNRAKKRALNRSLDGSIESNLDPYDVIQCLRNRLTATETELAEMKSREDTLVPNADALALVPKWNNRDKANSANSRGSRSVGSGKSQRSCKDLCKIDLTNADYVRKCKYMAKKLKESESNVKLLRTQIALANDIKADFDDLVEQRSDMGKQIVTLAKEKSEARRKITSLQVEIRTMRKEIDVINEQNVLLAKNNEQLGTNLKNTLRDKKLAKRQFDECNEELLLVRKKLDSMHQEKERLVVRIEDLEKKASKIIELRTTKSREVATSTSNIDIKSFEKSLMKLERSVEENLRLRKSVESLFSEESSTYGNGKEKIATNRSDRERMDEIYRVDVNQDSANEILYNDSDISVTTKEMSSLEDIQKQHRHSQEVKDDVSVCCLDSTCSVCSKKDCKMLHRSCSDIHCVMPYSEMDLGKGAGGRQPVRRVPAVEKLADIFGSDDDFEGIGAALHRSKKTDAVHTRVDSPNGSPNSSMTKGSLTNMLQDFTTSEESMTSTGTFDLSTIEESPKRRRLSSPKHAPSTAKSSSRRKTELSASSSNPTITKKSGKKMVSCFTSASEDGPTPMEMTGCLSHDPEIGEEDVLGIQSLAQLSGSATYVLGDGCYIRDRH